MLSRIDNSGTTISCLMLSNGCHITVIGYTYTTMINGGSYRPMMVEPRIHDHYWWLMLGMLDRCCCATAIYDCKTWWLMLSRVSAPAPIAHNQSRSELTSVHPRPWMYPYGWGCRPPSISPMQTRLLALPLSLLLDDHDDGEFYTCAKNIVRDFYVCVCACVNSHVFKTLHHIYLSNYLFFYLSTYLSI